jgi:hypothetical protein
MVGTVSGFRPDQQMGAGSIWQFKLERFDASGNRLQPVAVRMSAWKFTSTLNEGDRVAIPSAAMKSGTLHPKEVFNLTTGAEINTKRLPNGAGIGLAIMGVIVLVPVLLLVIWLATGPHL